MSLQIEGADGNKLDVTSRNMARVLAIAISAMHDAAVSQERAWTVLDFITPTGAGDFFFYLKNTGSRDLIITRLKVQAANTETVTLQRVTGTAAGGTTFTPANRKLGSGRQPDATVETAVDITGLTGAGDLEFVTTLDAVYENEDNDLTSRPIVVPQNQAVALVATTGAIAIDFQIDFMEQVADPAEIL